MKDKTLEEKVTKILVTVLDKGHYGFADCGHCHETLSEPYYKHKECPNCDYTFTGQQVLPGYGGSDF